MLWRYSSEVRDFLWTPLSQGWDPPSQVSLSLFSSSPPTVQTGLGLEVVTMISTAFEFIGNSFFSCGKINLMILSINDVSRRMSTSRPWTTPNHALKCRFPRRMCNNITPFMTKTTFVVATSPGSC